MSRAEHSFPSTLILEVKGLEDEQDQAKHEAAKSWCAAVSAWGKMGEWRFAVCKDPKKLNKKILHLIH